MATSPSPRDTAAVIAGRYAVREKLGAGSLGTVYLAYDEVSRTDVALKILRTDHVSNLVSGSIQDEFRAVALLRHPHIARAFDFGYTETGVPYYTREYVEGVPLPPGPPSMEPPEAFLRPVLDLLEALEYLHSQGMLHLDIHAGNVIVSRDPRRGSVLIDHGLVRSAGTSLFSCVGESWSTLPPEMLEKGNVTPRSDLFLVGRLLHHRLTGQTRGKPALPREIPGWGTRLTLDLERALVKALQPAPEQRFASPSEFHETLCRILGRTRTGPQSTEPFQPLMGRDRELGAVEDALRRAAEGSATLLWLAGGAGLGKTRLLSEARLRAQLRGLETAELRFLADHGPGPALARTLRTLRPRGPGSASWLEPLDPRCGGTPEDRARRAAASYFRGSGSGSAVLLDDFELADGESRHLAGALAAECARRQKEDARGRGLALIVTSTDPPPAGLLPRGSARLSVLRLRRLRRDEARELCRALLEPLTAPESLVERAVRAARGHPRALRQIACAWRETWKGSETIPESAEVPSLASSARETGLAGIGELRECDRWILETLAVLHRAATREELAAALSVPESSVQLGLRRLVKLELVVGQGRGRARRYQWTQPDAAARLRHNVPESTSRRLHRTLAARIRRRIRTGARTDARDQENLARHLLLAGQESEADSVAVEAARQLARSGAFDRAVVLLEEYTATTPDAQRRLAFAEEMCDVLSAAGDHEKGIEVIEPFYRDEPPGFGDRDRVRIRRRLGFHYHRAGRPKEALSVFGEAQEIAVAARDVEDLLFIDSELAELHIFLGNHTEAEEACRRGLERIEAHAPGREVHDRMEVLLRASLGHIEMRRLQLARAREELVRALRLSRRRSMLRDRAAILHNLGVTENELNRFSAARRYFAEARRLLLRSGRQRDAIKISTNLALIEAKLGQRDAAQAQLAQAGEMLRRFPGQRLECFVAYSRGVVSHLLGETDAAVEALAAAAATARKLGDVSLRGFALVHLAEAHIVSGRYTKALSVLRTLSRRSEEPRSPTLERMVACRRLLLETLLGRSRRLRAARQALEQLPRTEVTYLETWNDLCLAAARLTKGAAATGVLEETCRTFEDLGIPYGARLSRLGLLVEAVARGDRAAVRSQLASFAEAGEPPQLFLKVLEAVVTAEACLLLGDREESGRWLDAASSAIVGCRFLELDLRIELLRTRLAVAGGELRAARRHLHRAVHSQDLLLQFVPDDARKRFSEGARFASLRAAIARLRVSPSVELSTERLRRTRVYEGMLGETPAMVELFRSIERVREQDLPLLITGETGTGKELVARAIHSRSARRKKTFRSLCCASLAPELFESELFGHVAGAFTGAETDRTGLLEAAAGGTLLLDDLDLMPLASQAKLLRVLDSGVFRRLGSAEETRVDVRFLATTSADLRPAAEEGTFRSDLFYRFSGIELRVPPLRERPADIPALARHFLETHARRLDRGVPVLEPDALDALGRRSWPGNVRELEMLLLRACIQLRDPARIGAADIDELDPRPSSPPTPRLPRRRLLDRTLADLRRDLEREYLVQLFEEVDGDVQEMTRALEVKRSKLYRWLRDLGIDIRELRRRQQESE